MIKTEVQFAYNMKLQLIFGEGEIKRIDSQIKEAFKILNESTLLVGGPLKSHIAEKIKDLGFEYTRSSGNTFIGDRQVIKIALFTRRPPPIKYRVPTLIYSDERIKNWNWVYVLAIQPKVNPTIYESDDVNYIKYLNKNLPSGDWHSGNIGKYKGQILLFDW